MKLQTKGNTKEKSLILSVALGVCFSMLMTISGAALTALMVNGQTIGEGRAGLAAKIIVGLSTIVGCVVASLFAKRLRLQVCMLCGGTYYSVLLGMTALLFGGEYTSMGITALIVLIFCVGTAFIPDKKGRKWTHRNKGYR